MRLLASGVILLLLVCPARADDSAAVAFFEAKIRPVLVEHCYGCHSAEAATRNKLRAGLLLDTRAGLRKGGENGPVLVPGKPEDSLLVRTLRHAADAPAMPPGRQLAPAIVADFETWIRTGATDPRTGAAIAIKKGMSLEEGRRFWSLVGPVRAEPPPAPAGWATSEIDAFVHAGLVKHGLRPVADADRRSLIRRASFDLIGLPPSPDEVEAFVADTSLDAYEKVLDRLLASPHFGARWGRHWLDAVRYADSNGRDRNVLLYHAWRYRDYVVASFNRDRPYDRFLREQIAGDLLPADTPRDRDELHIATGFLALGSRAFEEQKPEVFRMDVIDEQIDVIGRSILGLSIACARCHDHKFDPIPTADYYALAGIFRSTEPLYGYGPKGIKATAYAHSSLYPVGPDANRLGGEGLAYFARLDALTLHQNTSRSLRYGVVRRLTDARLQLEKPGADRETLQANIERMETEIKEWDVKVKAAEAALQAAMDAPPPQPGWAMGVRERARAEDCRIHVRGETTSLGESVPRGVLRVLPQRATTLTGSGRKELADWLTVRDNPLTARVFVNRVWRHLFGRGLVATPDDFGVNGARPSHPELLDTLAVRFMDGGWSPKRLIRELMLTRTYRLATDADDTNRRIDPDNVYLWRRSPRRLEVEAFRDAVLVVSGQLDPSPAPPPLANYHPYRDAEYFSFKPAFTPAQLEHRYRSIYLPVVRGVLPEAFSLFDFPAPDRPAAQRDESTVPAQALYLMNSPWILDQARHAARRLLAELGSNEERVERFIRVAFSRPPTAREKTRFLDYLNAFDGAKTPEERWTGLCQAVLASAEFRTLP